MGPAEIERTLNRIFEMLPTFVTEAVWARENGHLREQIIEARSYAKEQIAEVDRASRERDEDLEETAMAAVKSVADASTKAVDDLKKTKQTTWSWTAQIIGWGIALVAAVIAAKGIK